MYNEDEIEFALRYRDREALAKEYQANESELLSTIRYTYFKDEVTKPSDKSYRNSFLNALNDHGIYFDGPHKSDDHKWHFYLPKIQGATNEEG